VEAQSAPPQNCLCPNCRGDGYIFLVYKGLSAFL
jgi:hypothetical protein